MKNSDVSHAPTITEKYPPLPLDELAALVTEFDGMSPEDKKALIHRLVAVHPTFSVDWGGNWHYRRCRKLDLGYRPETVDELIWPKGIPAKLGRANPAGFQVLYLADRQDTAFQEARVVDNPIVVADFKIQVGRSIRVAPIGELLQIHRTGRGPFAGDVSAMITNLLNACNRDEARSLLITDAFLLGCLVGHDDYDISSQVALSVFSKMPAVSAIGYPSRRQLGATNFAVRIERFWDNWALGSVRYGRAKELAMGFYKVSDAQAVVGIHNDGQLEWELLDDSEVTLELTPPFVASVST